MERAKTLAFGVVALSAWAGEFLFLIANSQAFGSFGKGLVWSSRFLTDWTGTLIALVATAVAFGWLRLSTPRWTTLATTAGLLVALMFAIMGGWSHLGISSMLKTSSLFAHVIAPIAMLLAWLLAFEHGHLRWRDAASFMLFPVIYLIQMLIRGALGEAYPYPEVDVERVGLVAALLFSAGTALLFFLGGLLLVGIDRAMARTRPARAHPSAEA